MYKLINTVIEERMLGDMADSAAMLAHIKGCGADGLEVICGGDDPRGIITPEMTIGYHLIFYSDWVDFWRGDMKKLMKKFGNMETLRRMYMCDSADGLIAQFKADMDKAEALGAKYAVFHVSDVSLDEGYTYNWEHSDREVIDASLELLNALLDGSDYSFELLLENLWWKGFSMTDPELTAYMLDGVNYAKKGIMLDTGHLMNANRSLRSQEEGVEFIHKMLDEHGEMTKFIRGIHLHQSVSGEYVQKSLGSQPVRETEYFKDFSAAYSHILQIDTHSPFTEASARSIIERLLPEYLVHELSAKTRAEQREKALIQGKTLGLI